MTHEMTYILNPKLPKEKGVVLLARNPKACTQHKKEKANK
jgi:hypothetical protein